MFSGLRCIALTASAPYLLSVIDPAITGDASMYNRAECLSGGIGEETIFIDLGNGVTDAGTGLTMCFCWIGGGQRICVLLAAKGVVGMD